MLRTPGALVQSHWGSKRGRKGKSHVTSGGSGDKETWCLSTSAAAGWTRGHMYEHAPGDVGHGAPKRRRKRWTPRALPRPPCPGAPPPPPLTWLRSPQTQRTAAAPLPNRSAPLRPRGREARQPRAATRPAQPVSAATTRARRLSQLRFAPRSPTPPASVRGSWAPLSLGRDPHGRAPHRRFLRSLPRRRCPCGSACGREHPARPEALAQHAAPDAELRARPLARPRAPGLYLFTIDYVTTTLSPRPAVPAPLLCVYNGAIARLAAARPRRPDAISACLWL